MHAWIWGFVWQCQRSLFSASEVQAHVVSTWTDEEAQQTKAADLLPPPHGGQSGQPSPTLAFLRAARIGTCIQSSGLLMITESHSSCNVVQASEAYSGLG